MTWDDDVRFRIRSIDHEYNILVLYHSGSVFTKNLRDHLHSFSIYSKFNVFYADASVESKCYFDVNLFDALIIHYSCALYRKDYISPSFREAIRGFMGPKLAFTQDEYDTTETTIQNLDQFGIDIFFTNVLDENFEKVYPKARLPKITLVNTLTAYVPLGLKDDRSLRPLRDRPIIVGYRGRSLHFKYGDLGQEKLNIGIRMKQACAERGLACDIEWTEQGRIYWNRWNDFLESCRVTLGTETGSNVFDFDGSLRSRIDADLASNPGFGYVDIKARHLVGEEGRFGVMGQVSGKVFEAIAHKTALVMFEGRYSDAVVPDRHYIVLKKDFSNLDEVMSKIGDMDLLEEMVERAYVDIIASEKYSYAKFVDGVVFRLRRILPPPKGVSMVSVLHAAIPGATHWDIHQTSADVVLHEVAQFDARCQRLYRAAISSPQGTGAEGEEIGKFVTTAPAYAIEEKILREGDASSQAVETLFDLGKLASSQPVYIFGTGRGGELLYDAMGKVPGLTVGGFVDVERSGELSGLPIHAVEHFVRTFPRDTPVVISNRFVVENSERLLNQGFISVYNGHLLVRWLASFL